jgi:hypothetical protein
VALDKFAEFARELRSSRSRTISLGLVSVAPAAPGAEVGYCRELREGYSAKGRIGKLSLAKEVEGYLVAPSGEWGGAAAGRGCVWRGVRRGGEGGLRRGGLWEEEVQEGGCGVTGGMWRGGE